MKGLQAGDRVVVVSVGQEEINQARGWQIGAVGVIDRLDDDVYPYHVVYDEDCIPRGYSKERQGFWLRYEEVEPFPENCPIYYNKPIEEPWPRVARIR